MFFTYVGRELRRRRRQAFVVALGLALGIGLVVTVSAMASGVRSAQASVLHSLYGVGTDVTVTRTAKARGYESTVRRHSGPSGTPLGRYGFDQAGQVDSVTSVVTLKRPAAELRLNRGANRWARLVGKVPGS